MEESLECCTIDNKLVAEDRDTWSGRIHGIGIGCKVTIL